MTSNRFQRWVYASSALAKAEQYMPVVAQGLGRLDARLVDETPRFITIWTQQRTKSTFEDEPTLLSNDHLLYSYLWILGAYELIRSLDQRSSQDPQLFGPDIAAAIKRLKHRFERVRIPLAKLEPAARYRETDSAIAWPVIHPKAGAGWQVGPKVYVARRELADAFLELLDRMRAGQDAA